MGCQCGEKQFNSKGLQLQKRQDKQQPVINAQTPVEELVQLFSGNFMSLHDSWWLWQNVQLAHQQLAREFISTIQPYPGGHEGKGIVICAGGHRLFTNAWVCMRMLRHHGCKLPIQFWHLRDEMDDDMRNIVKEYDVECVDASLLKIKHNTRVLAGWELKPFSIIHCPFKEVLLLDADNVPVTDPSFLFDCEAYKEKGAIFWPDFGKLAPNRPIWWLFETKYDDWAGQHEFESGQIVVDKERHWEPMQLTMWMNEHSDFYYRYIHGDKCTFEMAWKRLNKPFHLVQREIHRLDATMCQHSPVDHTRLFQHRNMDKWRLAGDNRHIRDFMFEDKCRDFLADLREKWSGQPGVSKQSCQAMNKHCGMYLYKRVGYDERRLELLPNGSIGAGHARCEMFWSLEENRDGAKTITIMGASPTKVTCYLKLVDNGEWHGSWLHHEKMPIELIPMASKS